MSRATSRASIVLALAALVAAPAGAQAATRGLDLGFFDPVFTTAPGEGWLARSAGAGADIVRIDVGWVAPNTATRPPGFDARNPGDTRYDFARADAAVRTASAKGLRVLLSFTGAPRWAEGRERPPGAVTGSWRPDPAALEDYGAALATRYSGRFPDPSVPGAVLPKVAALQVWNEPNLARYLSPQWTGGRPASPAHYRAMLNAFTRGVRGTGSDVLVVTAGTAPFGDPFAGGRRIMPADFVRDLLCLTPRGRPMRSAACAAPATFDVLAHHPYSVGSPARRAVNAGDVSIPDLGRLSRLLRAAERHRTAAPQRRHRLWVTEVSYDSGPPDPDGVPLATHARYLAQTLRTLWRSRVDTVIWFRTVDAAPEPSYAASSQSGVYLRDGRPKPALAAFRFPVTVRRSRGNRVEVWGRAPETGLVRIEGRKGGRWRVLQRIRVSRHDVFFTHIRRDAHTAVRARNGDKISLTWRLQ